MDVDTLKKIQDIGNILLIKCYLLTYYSYLYFIITRTESVTRISVWFKTSCTRASRPPKNKKRFAMISLISPYSPRAPHQVKSNWRSRRCPLGINTSGNTLWSSPWLYQSTHLMSFWSSWISPSPRTATRSVSPSRNLSFTPPPATSRVRKSSRTGHRATPSASRHS